MKQATKLLEDYNFRQDIDDRLFLSKLKLFEVEVLREILDGSLHFSIHSLADILAVSLAELEPVVSKFAASGILRVEGERIDVDKEKRKLLDLQIELFEEDFEPGVGYIFSLLRQKIPLHFLPLWYQISRAADYIFEALVEKFLQTPETYSRYLEETVFEEPILDEVRLAILNRKLLPSLAALRKKYRLTEEGLEEVILQLEYGFICCKVLRREGEGWVAELRPLADWTNFLQTIEKLRPKPVRGEAVGDRPFAFIEDMAETLEALKGASIPQKRGGAFDLSSFVGGGMSVIDLSGGAEEYVQEILTKAVALGLGVVKKGHFQVAPFAESWMDLSVSERAVHLHRHPSHATDERMWQVERCMKCLDVEGWMLFDDFIRFCHQPVADMPGVRMEKFGKRWKFVFPTMTEEARALIHETIFKRLFQVGMVDIGFFEGKECFRLTDFGRSILL